MACVVHQHAGGRVQASSVGQSVLERPRSHVSGSRWLSHRPGTGGVEKCRCGQDAKVKRMTMQRGFSLQESLSGAAIGNAVALLAFMLDASPWWWLAVPVGLL